MTKANQVVDEIRLKEMKGHAQKRFDEIQRLVLDGDTSLVQYLVKAYRVGHDSAKAQEAFTALKELIGDAEALYHAAIAQPEPKKSYTPRVVL